MGNITQNFSKVEFSCPCGCLKNNISPYLVHRLQVVRDITGLVMVILSGCRCEEHNRIVHGAPKSLHLTGEAADWYFDGDNNLVLKKVALNLLKDWSGGFHYYPDQNFIHTDIGKKRRW